MKNLKKPIVKIVNNARYMMQNPGGGMELVQVAILIAIAIVIGLIFRHQIKEFIDGIFSKLSAGNFL